MKFLYSWTRGPIARPIFVLIAVVALLALADAGKGRVLSLATGYSVLQQFATLGPIALALGLTMLVREFDLSIGGTLSLAGCVAVLIGNKDPMMGFVAAVSVGAVCGLVQSQIMSRLGLGSISVTLGGLLVISGLAYVITGNESIGFTHMEVVQTVNTRVGGVLSLRSILAIAVFIAAEFVISWTRIGRDVIAVGSDRRAALVAGVQVERILMVLFTIAAVLMASTGALLSFSLAAASPVGLADTLVPAAAAAIVGGVSLAGGKGRPLGIAAGVLVLCVLRSGLTAIGVPPFVHELASGAVLLAVALVDSEELSRRLHPMRRAFARSPSTP